MTDVTGGKEWENTRRLDARDGAVGQTYSNDIRNTYGSFSSQVRHWRSHDSQHSVASKLCIQLIYVRFWLAEALCNKRQLTCCFKDYITHIQFYKWHKYIPWEDIWTDFFWHCADRLIYVTYKIWKECFSTSAAAGQLKIHCLHFFKKLLQKAAMQFGTRCMRPALLMFGSTELKIFELYLNLPHVQLELKNILQFRSVVSWSPSILKSLFPSLFLILSCLQ